MLDQQFTTRGEFGLQGTSGNVRDIVVTLGGVATLHRTAPHFCGEELPRPDVNSAQPEKSRSTDKASQAWLVVYLQ